MMMMMMMMMITVLGYFALHVVMCNNILKPDRPQMTTWPMGFVCWITKATNTHPEYVILTAFPLHQRLQERISMLRYTYIACLVHSAGGTVISFVLLSVVGSMT